MKHGSTWKTAGLFFSIFTVCVLLSGMISAAEPLATTTFEIQSVKGGFGKVECIVKNTGNQTAKNITLNITVTGGILGRINITKTCTGCSNCGPDIAAGTTRTESTKETGTIFGFGSIDILVTAKAENAPKVSTTKTGFVLGFFVIVN